MPPQAALALGRAAGAGRAFAGPAAAGGTPDEALPIGRAFPNEKVFLLAENAALRQLVGCGRGITGVTPARVVARGVGGFTLACPDTAPGNAVLDAGGRYAGVVTRTDGDTCTVEFSATAGLCGSYAGLVTPGQWVLTGLPADCALTAGDIVTTAGGDWLGTLAAAPAPDADGLTAQVPLTDTADLWGTVYFVKK